MCSKYTRLMCHLITCAPNTHASCAIWRSHVLQIHTPHVPFDHMCSKYTRLMCHLITCAPNTHASCAIWSTCDQMAHEACVFGAHVIKWHMRRVYLEHM